MAHFPVRKLKTFTRPGRQIDDSSDEIPKTPAQIYGPQTFFFFSHRTQKNVPMARNCAQIPDVQKDQLVKTLKFIIVAGLSHQRHIS